MDLAFRYPLIVQVITRNGHDVFYGCSPDFGIESFEVVQAGSVSQEVMFHVKMRRMIGESITALRNEARELPPIRQGSLLFDSSAEDMRKDSAETVSTTVASEILGVHPDTIRSLFDRGVIRGSLSQGGQRMIALESVREEEGRQLHRAEMRKFEQRAKKKNQRRKERRIKKHKEETARRFHENHAELERIILKEQQANATLPG